MDEDTSLVLAKMEIERYIEYANDEVRKAWRLILAELDASSRMKRRKIG